MHGGWLALVVLVTAARPLIGNAEGSGFEHLPSEWWLWHGCLAIAGLRTLMVVRRVACGWLGWMSLAALALTVVAALGAVHLQPAMVFALEWAAIVVLGWVLCQCPLRVALSGLAAGACGMSLLALGQWGFALPAMRALDDASITAQLRAASPALAAEGTDWPAMLHAFRERVAKGGCYGPFTLGNTLAIACAVVLPIVLYSAWVTRLVAARVVMGVVGALIIAALWCAEAKGVWPALALGGAWAAWRHAPGRWRWAGPGALLLGLLALSVSSALHEKLAPSVMVRVQYWRAAWGLIAERPLLGHGLDGFQHGAAAYRRAGEEATTLAHNEVIEAAVAGGVVFAVIIAALLIALAMRPRAVELTRAALQQSDDQDASERSAKQMALHLLWCVPLAMSLALLSLQGDAGVGWWPGVQSASEATSSAAAGWWILLIVGCMSVAGMAAYASRITAMWPITLGLTAFAVGCLIDFHLHAPGLGALVVAAVAGSAARCQGASTEPSL